jgi:hypothetical protein
MTTAAQVNGDVLSGVEEQLRDLRPLVDEQAPLADLLGRLTQFETLFDGTHGFPTDAAVSAALRHKAAAKDPGGVIDQVSSLIDGTGTTADLGRVLVSLYGLQQLFQAKVASWLAQRSANEADAEQATDVLLKCVVQVRQLLQYRPDVGAIMDDLSAIKSLAGGPADVVAFHDFNALQLAFRSVWMHAFSDSLTTAAAQLYEQTVMQFEDMGLTAPSFDAVEDIDQLNAFINEASQVTTQITGETPAGLPDLKPPSALVVQYFPQAATVWPLFNDDQRNAIENYANHSAYANSGGVATYAGIMAVENDQKAVAAIVKTPMGTASRLTQLIAEIGKELAEPYAFDVFAPDSYNYGLVCTYRQEWRPTTYQAGNLVATIPLAPGETRKYSKKTTVKQSVARKETERATSSRSLQTTDTSRAELAIMEKVSTATNFKMTSHGSFNVGIGNIENTTEFGGNAANESAKNKQEFHEATIKAAEEYKLERSMEVDTNTSTDIEDVTSGEISNPNNEITVTYLFYELQRRYLVREYLYRVRPVILIAQEVPSPHEIDEAWLIKYQWIIARVLLDDSFRPALGYLTTGFAGDEVSIEIIKSNWETQQALVVHCEKMVQQQQDERDHQRETLVKLTEELDEIPEMPGILNVFTMGVDPSDSLKQALKGQKKAGEARLKYTEQALADAQDKLRSAMSDFEKSTSKYAEAMKNQYARHVAIDQLRIHIKQNVLYYMQAIWAHEEPDQRFFRLYRKKVLCPVAQTHCNPTYTHNSFLTTSVSSIYLELENTCVPAVTGGGVGGPQHDLVEVADLDTLLGFKGNYLMFPLKDDCALTQYMLSDYVDSYLGLRDPDGSDDFDAAVFDTAWQAAAKAKDNTTLDTLRQYLKDHIADLNERTDEIVVPTGQLFIEALPGSHPLLEDFKLMHRFEDLRKVRAEVRHAELENLRLASRLAANPQLLQDPHIDKRIVVDQGVGVVMDSNP